MTAWIIEWNRDGVWEPLNGGYGWFCFPNEADAVAFAIQEASARGLELRAAAYVRTEAQ